MGLMANDQYYHQRFFRTLYRDMTRRLNNYNKIQQIPIGDERKRKEQQFLEEQRIMIKKFLQQEKYAINKLNEGLRQQQTDIESWWKRNIEFRRIQRNCMDRFSNLIAFARKVESILSRENFDEKDAQTIIAEIEYEIRTIIHLSDDYEIKKYGQGILPKKQE